MVECIILVGLQGAGKTTFYRRHFAGSHVHASMDRFPNARRKATRVASEIAQALDAGQSVVVDNTNPTIAVRAPLISMARVRGAEVIGYYVEATREEALARNRQREGRARVPDVGIFATAKRLEPPSRAEGFHRLHRARMSEDGSFAVEEWIGDMARFRLASTGGRGDLECRVYIPPGYDESAARWPLVVFLHADSESGRDNLSQTSVGLGPALVRHSGRWPFVAAFPQKPERRVPWTAHRDALGALVEETSERYAIDPSRRYLTGVAEGGDAAWALGMARPDVWAALALVDAVRVPAEARVPSAMPTWSFRGQAGEIQPADVAIAQSDVRITLTSYDTRAHDEVVELAYAEPDLPTWLLRHTLGGQS
jgi:poly(3-hydroxybutyrate) depolymerase